MVSLTLNQQIHKQLRRGHPWVFADAINPPETLETGAVVDIVDQHGEFVGRGIFERKSPIAVRMWTLKNEKVDDELLWKRVVAANQQRQFAFDGGTTGIRLLNGEGDRTPGVVCDLYGNVAVVRLDGRAAERWLAAVVEAVRNLREVEHVVVRRSEKYRDDFPKSMWLETQPDDGFAYFQEHGVAFVCDPISGQKTGFFLDQRANRQQLAKWSQGRRLLNLFGYTGGFSVVAAVEGAAQTTTVDLAKPALDTARSNFVLNGLDPEQHDFVASDVEKYLDGFHPRTAPFDVVVCDPPSFAHRKKDKSKAIKTYRRLFAKTLRVMPRGSTVALASCSSHIGQGDFRAIVREAAELAEVNLTMHGVFGPDVDHPYPAGFPEHDYLQFAIGVLS